MKIFAIAKRDEIDALARELRGYSAQLCVARSGRAVLGALPEADAVLVDFALAFDSVDFCRAIRARSDIPTVALVDNPKIGRTVLELRAGVDDYLCKPFRAAALVARLDGILRARNHEPDPPDELLLDDVAIDFRGRTITVENRTLQLTRRQYQILALLAEHYGAVCPKDALISRIWGNSWHGADQSLYVHINALRGKIGRPRLIQTVRGQGYRLAPLCASPTTSGWPSTSGSSEVVVKVPVDRHVGADVHLDRTDVGGRAGEGLPEVTVPIQGGVPGTQSAAAASRRGVPGHQHRRVTGAIVRHDVDIPGLALDAEAEFPLAGRAVAAGAGR